MLARGALAGTMIVSISLAGCSAGAGAPHPGSRAAPAAAQSQGPAGRQRDAAAFLDAGFNGRPAATRLAAPDSPARRWVAVQQVTRAAYVANGDGSLRSRYSVGTAGQGSFRVTSKGEAPVHARDVEFNRQGQVVTFAGLGHAVTKHRSRSVVAHVGYLLVGAVHFAGSLTVALKVTAARSPLILDTSPTYVARNGIQYRAGDSEVASGALRPGASTYAVYYFPGSAGTGGDLYLQSYAGRRPWHMHVANLSVR